MTAAGLLCESCGTELSGAARFCSQCGAAVSSASQPAEYKQVTVLFADVVHSMDIAAAVGAERLREIMAELLDRSTAVVKRYGGTLSQFTGDGIMAVFGAPVALEDHAVRACLTALDIQNEVGIVAAEVKRLNDITLQLRIGLNSGEVIAGEIGSSTASYTTIGEQVGMAQRMESAAPPGGVMLSESTARLVRHAALLSEVQRVHIKGATDAVTAFRLLRLDSDHDLLSGGATRLIGRRWEVAALEAILGRAIDGQGGVVSIVGPAGIGKSRLVRELAAIATNRGVEIFGGWACVGRDRRHRRQQLRIPRGAESGESDGGANHALVSVDIDLVADDRYCGAGAAAASLATMVVRLGHPRVAIYDGGLMEWCADRQAATADR